jgi:hypothetical protein
LEVQLGAPSRERQAAGDVQQLVGQPLEFALRELARQQRRWVQTIRSCASSTIL